MSKNFISGDLRINFGNFAKCPNYHVKAIPFNDVLFKCIYRLNEI